MSCAPITGAGLPIVYWGKTTQIESSAFANFTSETVFYQGNALGGDGSQNTTLTLSDPLGVAALSYSIGTRNVTWLPAGGYCDQGKTFYSGKVSTWCTTIAMPGRDLAMAFPPTSM